MTVACYLRDGRTPEALMAAASRQKDDGRLPSFPGRRLERLRTVAERFVDPHEASVLLLGETGKCDVLSSMIHRLSPAPRDRTCASTAAPCR